MGLIKKTFYLEEYRGFVIKGYDDSSYSVSPKGMPLLKISKGLHSIKDCKKLVDTCYARANAKKEFKMNK
jgi:hypothetical protein